MQHVTSLQCGLIKKNREVKEEVVESQETLSNRSFCRIHEEDLDLYFKFSPAWFIHFVWGFCYNCIETRCQKIIIRIIKQVAIHQCQEYYCSSISYLPYWTKSDKNSAHSYPQDAHPIDLVPQCKAVTIRAGRGWGFSPVTMSMSSSNFYRKQKENRTKITS